MAPEWEHRCTAPLKLETACAGSVGCSGAQQGSGTGHRAGPWGSESKLSIFFWAHLPQWCWDSLLWSRQLSGAAGSGCVLLSRGSLCWYSLQVRCFSEGDQVKHCLRCSSDIYSINSQVFPQGASNNSHFDWPLPCRQPKDLCLKSLFSNGS